MKRVGIGITIAGAALALATTPAQAAGTIHNDYPQHCDTYPDYADGYYTVCYSSSDQYNDTLTPSGDESYEGKGTTTISVSGTYYSSTDTYNYKIHELVKKGERQVVHADYSYIYSYYGTTCTFTQHYQFANGAVLHFKPTFGCS